jgi:predicted transcriptional regulator
MFQVTKDQDLVREKIIQTMIDYRILTLVDFSDRIGISHTTIYKFVSGKEATIKTIVKIFNGIDKIREEHGR